MENYTSDEQQLNIVPKSFLLFNGVVVVLIIGMFFAIYGVVNKSVKKEIATQNELIVPMEFQNESPGQLPESRVRRMRRHRTK